VNNPQSSLSNISQSTHNPPTIAFCDLLCKPKTYDGQEVRFRAKHISTFETSAFVDSNCTDKDNLVWVEFDRTSVKASTTPKVLRKLEEQVYCCMYSGLSETRETDMLVTAIFHKPNNQGYGHDNNYRFMITVKRVEEVGTTKKIRVPGFE
jgi:hypothetical protein